MKRVISKVKIEYTDGTIKFVLGDSPTPDNWKSEYASDASRGLPLYKDILPKDFTVEDWLNRQVERCIKEGDTDVRIVETSQIPTDRTFRDAWTDDNPTDTVDVCMVKARNIHMGRLRKMRDEKFDEMGFGKKLAPEIEEALVSEENKIKLKAFRDMPANVDLELATTPEELKAILPEELV